MERDIHKHAPMIQSCATIHRISSVVVINHALINLQTHERMYQ